MKALSSIFLIFTFSFFLHTNAQVNDHANRQLVLEKSIVDSLFVFGKWTENGGTETHITYLGKVTTKHGHTFKILGSIWFWGLSHRATSRILIFNDNNKYVGNYYVAMTTYLPTKMENGKLIFKNINNGCDKYLTTIVELKNGLPKQFFRKCKGTYGDIYNFETE